MSTGGGDAEDEAEPTHSIAPLRNAQIDKFFEIQKLQEENRKLELINDSQQLETGNREYELAIRANVDDRKDERQHRRHIVDKVTLVACLVVTCVAVVIVVSMLTNHADVALELIKLFAALTVGAAGGYGVRASQDKRRDADATSEDD